MKLNALKLANATALTALILYVVCTIFVTVAPEAAMTIAAGITHIPGLGDTLGAVEVTLGGFLLGLIPLFVYAYIGSYLIATLYNRAIRS